MRRVVITLVAGAGAVFAGSAANATDIYTEQRIRRFGPAARADCADDL